MDYKVVLPKKVKDSLAGIQKQYKDQILVALKGLQRSPLLGKKLWGQYKSYRSFRIGEYRIIYQVRASELLILVIKIGNRQGVY